MHSKEADSKAVLNILGAQLLVSESDLIPVPDSAQHGSTGVAIARYNITSVEVKTFTLAKCSQSLSIDNDILEPIHKSLLFVMLDNTVSLLPDYESFQVASL